MDQFVTFVGNNWGLFVALVVILLLMTGNILKPKLLGFKEIKPAEAVSLMNHSKAVIVDVRADKDFNTGHIINALNLPLASLQDELGKIEKYKSRPVIVYCDVGQKSAQAAARLSKNGFESVYKLAGGLHDWKGAQLPLSQA